MSEQAPDTHAHPAVIRHLGVKVALLAMLTAILLVGFVFYLLYARGVFEATQKLTIVTTNAEGVTVGMPLNLSGLPVGRVRDVGLGPDGRARIEVDVPKRSAHWLRERSIFLVEHSLVGGTKLRMFSTDLGSPALRDGAEVQALPGDTTAEIPQIVANLKNVLGNMERITAAESPLNASIASVQAFTGRLAGKHGMLEGALGNPESAAKVIAAIDRANALLASLQGLTVRVDTVVGKADQRVLGPGGVLDQAQKAGVQLNTILLDARESLKRADAVLADAQVASGNVKAATADLATLRAEVDASLRKIGSLIDEVNRKWPFERNTEIRLP
jgi:phospholipid/cholesterol/gamma-HCH transport system substrate-binding protein